MALERLILAFWVKNKEVQKVKAQQVESVIRWVPIAEEKWAAQSHALSAHPGAKRPGIFQIFEF